MGKYFINQQQAAEILGVSDRRVRQMVKEDDGCPADPEGRVPCDEFGEFLTRRFLKKFGGAGPGGDEALVLEQERAALARAQTENFTLRNAELRGDLVRADHVRAFLQSVVTAARTRVLGIHARVRQRHPHTELAIIEEIEAAAHEALSELARDDLPANLAAAVATDGSALGATEEADA
jgi:phage terminase Nu1 subunit (DNA packaging protein)